MADLKLKVTVVRNTRQEATLIMTVPEDIKSRELFEKAAREADAGNLWTAGERKVSTEISNFGSSWEILDA